MKRLFLLLSAHPPLRKRRSEVVTNAEFIVVAASNEVEAEQLIRAAAFDALLLGHDVTRLTASKIVPIFRKANKRATIIARLNSAAADFADVGVPN
jgi:DNA-binding response OmpR family regulator